ncbi:phosphatidate cytidylyltransferase [Novosphingobium flavum]|uniref:Phosphatidate cytidylyltransferase n=1 Tax=Novosphingobium flavum TaxID=1778672 RepID=A0A7X1FQB0_9SPHN|nr:phosphatidate cytidylyltransferase [Novosphingobium flavum]MBC2664869.1 phosphatidate cytidylyltransferase [Novosphingobium flavum]
MADGEGTPQAAAKRNPDLMARTISAVVMVLVAGAALWLGGWTWIGFVALIAAVVLWEWNKLVRTFASEEWLRLIWLGAGVFYVGIAISLPIQAGVVDLPLGFEVIHHFWASMRAQVILPIVLAVAATDIGAYFAGRTFGGPKIAPRISPSKTWSGLLGGALASSLVVGMTTTIGFECYDCAPGSVWRAALVRAVIWGPLIAVIAQAGDFFESWMKRRAGVKDSGRLIPGHGGLFDRVDGLIAVCFAIGLFMLASGMLGR